MQDKSLIFIVAYNHQNFIKKVVARIPDVIKQDPNIEILIIDDGSKDNTFNVADQIQKEMNLRAKITVLRNPMNQGYGGNQKLGYRYAIMNGFTRVVLLHGDGQYAPEILPDIIANYHVIDAKTGKKPDAVFGTRMADFWSPLKGGMPVYKFIGNKILSFLENRMLGTRMSEFHSGYRSYSVELLKKIPFELNTNDFHFDTEIIIQTVAAKGTIKEIPIPTYYGDEICHVNGMQYAGKVLKACMHYVVMQYGFLYDRKYDVDHYVYDDKLSPYSSHNYVVRSIPVGSRVLDIGCGSGQIAKLLKANQCEVDGIDIIDKSKTFPGLRNYYQIDLIRNPEALKKIVHENEYDYIVLADILEHMTDPEKLIDDIRAGIGGKKIPTIVATTGNVAFGLLRLMLLFGQFNYGIKGILDITHTRLFTLRNFTRLFEQSSYRIEETKPIPMPFSVLFKEKSLLARFLERANLLLIRLFPKFYSYQFLITAKPMPTVSFLLENSLKHSADLRERRTQAHT